MVTSVELFVTTTSAHSVLHLLLAPYLALAGLAIVISAVVVVKRRRD
jgi:hypothetical protein